MVYHCLSLANQGRLMNVKRHRFSWVIIGAGLLFSLFLLWQVPNGVYFSGDGGLKALLAQQLGSGIGRIDLAKPDAEWVLQLWNEGLYPYEEPFVYQLDERYFITFPFTFPLVTAPFYALFGYRGLYFVPLVSTWLIWLIFLGMCRRLNFQAFPEYLALILLIFTSNLTLYSGMYWEHTLAFLFCFAGMVIFLVPKSVNSDKQEIKNAILSGILIGLSVWVRSEFLAMVATLTFIVSIISLSRYLKQRSQISIVCGLDKFLYLSRNGWLFIVSMFATVGLFFLCNKLIYNHFLGVHALQIVEKFSLTQRLMDAWRSLLEIIITFFEYFPVACFSLLYLVLFLITKSSQNKLARLITIGILLFGLITSVYWINIQGTNEIISFLKSWGILVLLSVIWLLISRKTELILDSKTTLFYLISLLFTIGVALLVVPSSGQIAVGGKQWGQRYLLILIPFFSIITVKQISFFSQNKKPLIKYFSIFLFSIFTIIGFYKNVYQGTQFFEKAHQGVRSSIEQLQTSPYQTVVVSHQYAAQILEPPLKQEKQFFKADQFDNLIKLSQKLIENNQSGFSYVCYPYRKCDIPQRITESGKFTSNNQSFKIQWEALEERGKYPIYNAKFIKQ